MVAATPGPLAGPGRQLRVTLGQHSEQGRKPVQQDFHGACIPEEPQLGAKGIAVALADGVSSSAVSRVASETAVKAFLDDYFCTSPAWSVKTSAHRVLAALNSWLHSQSRQSPYRYERDRGYVCTLSALVIKSATAHLFHVGDARIYRLREGSLEQLTNDHRVWVTREESYLGRALGFNPQVEIDYHALAVEQDDVFILLTDGVHEFVTPQFIAEAVCQHAGDLDRAARALIEEAYRCGSDDNLTVQIVRVEELPAQSASDVHQQLTELPLPPELSPRMCFDGYRIIRELHSTSRSHVYLAADEGSAAPVVIKVPSVDLRADPAYLERFLMEDWIARRIDNPHVAKASDPARRRNYLYSVMEFVDGQTLRQWMIDNPRPSLETVRGIIEQIARGLMAFHRLEMLHQDLRPENVMIDRTGTVKIVDFGSTHVAGIAESAAPATHSEILGTAQYTAPEYFLGEAGTPRADLFSLGVIAYEMLSGKLPYGAEVAQSRTRAAQRRLRYRPLVDEHRAIPAWIDDVLRRATHPDPRERYEELSELLYDLRHPNPAYLKRTRPPLIERDPLMFWKALSAILLLIIAMLLSR
ncbi:MAG: bifunctional protein-serine/threonine kinase/phosphatase [Steroidobacteraceae bacterium]|nr:bifunctional protein-serine/threonine kinase/phosphatase [Steroidobacteraceae bacterium]